MLVRGRNIFFRIFKCSSFSPGHPQDSNMCKTSNHLFMTITSSLRLLYIFDHSGQLCGTPGDNRPVNLLQSECTWKCHIFLYMYFLRRLLVPSMQHCPCCWSWLFAYHKQYQSHKFSTSSLVWQAANWAIWDLCK